MIPCVSVWVNVPKANEKSQSATPGEISSANNTRDADDVGGGGNANANNNAQNTENISWPKKSEEEKIAEERKKARINNSSKKAEEAVFYYTENDAVYLPIIDRAYNSASARLLEYFNAIFWNGQVCVLTFSILEWTRFACSWDNNWMTDTSQNDN